MEFKVEMKKKKGTLEPFIAEALTEHYYFLKMNFIFTNS